MMNLNLECDELNLKYHNLGGGRERVWVEGCRGVGWVHKIRRVGIKYD